MAHSKNRATDGKITYPPGVKEISDKISKEEMVRRLKVGGNLKSGSDVKLRHLGAFVCFLFYTMSRTFAIAREAYLVLSRCLYLNGM